MSARSLTVREETLWCVEGAHEWTRPLKVGNKPKYCPEHRSAVTRRTHARNMNAWRARNPEKTKESRREAVKRRDEREPNWRKVEMYYYRYGMPRREATELISGRPEVCQLCGGVCKDGRVCYDHCHETNKHRGWLCSSCNRGIGYFRDDPALLRAAADYLEAALNGSR